MPPRQRRVGAAPAPIIAVLPDRRAPHRPAWNERLAAATTMRGRLVDILA